MVVQVGGVEVKPGLKNHEKEMLLAIAWLLASVGAGHLLVLKTYDPVAISLDTPCVVRYKFVNPSEQYKYVIYP